MKRVTAFVLFICTILFCAGCQAPAEDLQNSISDPSSPGATIADADVQNPSVYFENLYAISVPLATEQIRAQDGALVFEYIEPVMYLTVPDNEVARKIIVDFLTRIDSSRSAAESVHMQALNDYNKDTDWIPYTYRIHYNPMRMDPGVLSLLGEVNTFSGGSHPDRTFVSASYDMMTGDTLTLGSILYHVDTKDDLCQLVIDKLDVLSNTTHLYDYYAEAAEDYFNQDESHMESFYFTEDSLCFYFAPYEIAPYSSGIIIVSIPYTELTGIIGDQFFPAEAQVTTGNVEAHLFSDVDLEQYQQFAELTTEVGGEKIIISTDGIIQNVTIHNGIWNADGTLFAVESTLFYANALSSTDAIMLETVVPDSLPALMLTYQSNGKAYSYYISRDPANGAILLNAVK